MTTRIPVSAASGVYEVILGVDLLSNAAQLLEPLDLVPNGLVVADQSVAQTHANRVIHSLQDAGWMIKQVTVEAIESRKRMDVVEGIWAEALSSGIGRDGCFLSVGGGLTGDVTGFAAATYMRGIRCIQIPTSLLAMVDASIGGKTGVNVPLPDGAGLGKNLAGAFWTPELVIADVDCLSTLPDREFRSGLAECVKHGLISDRRILEVLNSQPAPVRWSQEGDWLEVMSRAIEVKRDVVVADEREQGTRMHLNLGHTFAHVIEPMEAFDLTHGEAVAIGLVAATACSVQLGMVEQRALEALRSLLEHLSLPTRLPAPCPAAELRARMQHDKKVAAGQLRLILPTGETACVRNDVPVGVVDAAWHEVGASD